MKQRIYLIHTGGTIGMAPTPDGYGPAPGHLALQMARLPELEHPDMPEFVIHDHDPLVDSADMTPAHWLRIARDIADHYDEYDGFVILHGTDTMSYTASALPFLLEGLDKPVILTGSQIPLRELRNDARANLVTAMLIAARYAIPEVCLFFGDHLFRGCRSVKVHASGFDAFASPNYPALGRVGIDIDIRRDLILPPAGGKLSLPGDPGMNVHVAALRLFPGISAEAVASLLTTPVRGLVLETYGVGNAPASDTALMSVLRDATDRGVIIVNCTQCLAGGVHMDAYATGSALGRAGVLGGRDMTAEAALAKLVVLFQRNLAVPEIRRLMETNLKGELTPRP